MNQIKPFCDIFIHQQIFDQSKSIFRTEAAGCFYVSFNISRNEVVLASVFCTLVSPLTYSSYKHFEYPLNSILYRETGVYKDVQFSLFFIQNIHCGYSLEPPRRGVSNHFIKYIKFFPMKVSIFRAVYYMGGCI